MLDDILYSYNENSDKIYYLATNKITGDRWTLTYYKKTKAMLWIPIKKGNWDARYSFIDYTTGEDWTELYRVYDIEHDYF